MDKPQPSALDSALKYLRQNDRSEAEIRQYLTQKEFDGNAVNACIAALRAYGYLNDNGLAARIINTKKQKHLGDLAIEQTLQSRGLDQEVHSKNSQERALQVLKLKFPHDAESQDHKVIAKAARFLGTRGYREEEISDVLQSYFQNFDFDF